MVQVSASPDLEVERLFKKSIKRHSRPNGLYFCNSRPKYCPVSQHLQQLDNVLFFIIIIITIKEFVSTMDLRNEPGAPDPSMGSRSRSVPGLDIKASDIDLFCHECTHST